MLRPALKQQYHAGIVMLRDCIEKCPEEIWTSGKHPRNFWRIAYHAVFYTHLYLGQTEADFVPWHKHDTTVPSLWGRPKKRDPYTKEEVLEYLQHLDGLIDPTVDALDLETTKSGFSWYKNITKLSHQLLNLRHIQGHTGQLSEILMQNGIDTDWNSRG